MLCSPELMLMDEPFASLDAITRVQLQDMIKAIQASYELTIIFVTHDIGEALKLSNKLLVVGRDGSCQTIDGPALSMLTESDITKMFGKSKDI
ncbi:ABC transporter ATP-binding protein [Aduncisulcus paluster]|uniref:ABC transporter ATP-binding protein n=1 Tax=Aduncisulcus paluster TaxID=2918883 RepID=A0ABQ5K2I6_9EUKA|nr:ABC transporter ATP-binding protein [Aduncisulcus paluster]